MKTIHIARGQSRLGQFSPQEVADGLHSGRFLPSDLGWSEGMSTWTPLAQFSDLPPPQHEDIPPLPAESPFATDLGSPLAMLATNAPQPAWEQRETKGFVNAFMESIGQILTKPSATFATMPKLGGFFAPLLFTILATWLGNAAAITYHLIYVSISPQQVAEELHGMSSEQWRLYWIGALIILPVVIVPVTFLSALFTHFFLWLTGGAKTPYETTFRVVAYVQGATSMIQLIPICGGMLYPVWYFFSAAIGLAKTNETEIWRSVLALLMPFLLCCGLLIGLVLLLGSAATLPAVERGISPGF